jgi:hypothetical protein
MSKPKLKNYRVPVVFHCEFGAEVEVEATSAREAALLAVTDESLAPVVVETARQAAIHSHGFPELLAALTERTAACKALRQRVTMYYMSINGDTARLFERMVFPALEIVADEGRHTAALAKAERGSLAIEAELPRPGSPPEPAFGPHI